MAYPYSTVFIAPNDITQYQQVYWDPYTRQWRDRTVTKIPYKPKKCKLEDCHNSRNGKYKHCSRKCAKISKGLCIKQGCKNYSAFGSHKCTYHDNKSCNNNNNNNYNSYNNNYNSRSSYNNNSSSRCVNHRCNNYARLGSHRCYDCDKHIHKNSNMKHMPFY